ncbi:MAG: dual specificity protein phosphatase family protein [Nitrososphaerota archaeon]|nr:dual specificity protein phosphatase family protein [Nitrososphaerota archaeon]
MEIGDILRKIYDSIYHRPMNFSFIDNYVCGSARIMSKQDIDWLKLKGVKAVLALTETAIPSSWVEASGIEYKHVPVKNHTSPSIEQLDDCVNFIERIGREGKKTLVHCAAGKGRTGTVLAAYLCEHNDISAETAIEQVRTKRGGSIENDPESGQENVVIEFCQILHKKKKSA